MEGEIGEVWHTYTLDIWWIVLAEHEHQTPNATMKRWWCYVWASELGERWFVQDAYGFTPSHALRRWNGSPPLPEWP